MDLGSVQQRLERGEYDEAEQVAADLRLVFANSRLYNTNKRSRVRLRPTIPLHSRLCVLHIRLLIPDIFDDGPSVLSLRSSVDANASREYAQHASLDETSTGQAFETDQESGR